MHSQQSQVACCCKLSCNPQVVTPAGAGTAKASEAAQTGSASAAAPSTSPGVSQQGQIIGVRTLLEFVAWLVCASLKDSSASPAQGKLRSAAAPAGPARRGAAFLTEELSSVGVAVRRMQVSNRLSVGNRDKKILPFWRQFNDKPSIIPGCLVCQLPHVVPGVCVQCSAVNVTPVMTDHSGRQAASVCWLSSHLSGLLRLLLHADTKCSTVLLPSLYVRLEVVVTLCCGL